MGRGHPYAARDVGRGVARGGGLHHFRGLPGLQGDEVERGRAGGGAVDGREVFARVGGWNLGLLLLFAIADGALGGFGVLFFVEYVLLAVLLGLTGVHGAYFGRKIAELAAAEAGAGSAGEAKSFAEQRRALGRVSLMVSRLDLLVSVAIVALAVNA